MYSGRKTPWLPRTMPTMEDPHPSGSWGWLWWDIDVTLWALALVVDLKEDVVGIIIGPLKFGVQW